MGDWKGPIPLDLNYIITVSHLICFMSRVVLNEGGVFRHDAFWAWKAHCTCVHCVGSISKRALSQKRKFTTTSSDLKQQDPPLFNQLFDFSLVDLLGNRHCITWTSLTGRNLNVIWKELRIIAVNLAITHNADPGGPHGET